MIIIFFIFFYIFLFFYFYLFCTFHKAYEVIKFIRQVKLRFHFEPFEAIKNVNSVSGVARGVR